MADMRHLIFYYSYTGSTRKLAHEQAAKEGAELCEVRDRSRPGTLLAYTGGCFAAVKGKRGEIMPFMERLEDYDKITLMAPVWAGNPPPAAWSMLDMLPPGKEIAVWMVSGSGKSGAKDKICTLLQRRGCNLSRYRDIKRRELMGL